MHDTGWQLRGQHAQLTAGWLSADVDLCAPQKGLQPVGVGEQLAPSRHHLGIELASTEAAAVDGYVRGRDLVATYAPQGSWPFLTQVYWSLWSSKPADAAAIELVASVQTDLLETQPSLFTTTSVAANEVLRLVDAARERFVILVPATAGSLSLVPRDGCGCLLLRTAEGTQSYAEMVHPADFVHSELQVAPAPGQSAATCSLRHRLFAEHLEKGVILRARVLAAWVDRARDEELVSTLYREFAASAPPLTT